MATFLAAQGPQRLTAALARAEGMFGVESVSLSRPIHRVCLSLGLGLGLGLGLAAPAARAADPPASLRALLDLAGPDAVDPEVSYTELEALLAAGLPGSNDSLADGATLPDISPEALDSLRRLDCGTSVLRAAARLASSPGHADLALLAAGPRLASPTQLPVVGEPFIIRYDVSVASRHAVSGRDSDRDGLADSVAEVVTNLRLSSRRLSELASWTPRADGIDVVLGRSPFAEGATLGGTRPLIVIPTGLRGPTLLAAVAHQVAHVAVQDLAAGAPESFEEALATYLGEAILSESAGLDVNLEQLLPRRHASRALLSPGPLGARGDANFLRYLGAELDPAPWLGQTLAAFPRQLEDAKRSLDPRAAGPLASPLAGLVAVTESLDQMLTSQGWSLAEAVSSYQKWTLEQDLLAHGQSASVDDDLGSLPAEESRSADALAAFGQLRFSVDIPAEGGLRLSFDSDARLTATAMALLNDGTVREFPIGRRTQPTMLAGGNLSRLIVLLQSPERPLAWSQGLPSVSDSLRSDRPFNLAAHAEPGYPFTMTSLGTEVAPGQVTISWDTLDEQDLVAWWVERAVRPAGPYLRVSSAPMPPLSWPGERAAYSFVDASVRPSSRYHYRVQAITSSGLRETSASTSVRSLPAAQRPTSSR